VDDDRALVDKERRPPDHFFDYPIELARVSAVAIDSFVLEGIPLYPESQTSKSSHMHHDPQLHTPDAGLLDLVAIENIFPLP
jgi:hypothetical protein